MIAETVTDDTKIDIKISILSLFSDRPLRHELLVDSKSLFDTIATLQQGD